MKRPSARRAPEEERELVSLLASSSEWDRRQGEDRLKKLGPDALAVLARIRESNPPRVPWCLLLACSAAVLGGLLMADPADGPLLGLLVLAGTAAAATGFSVRRAAAEATRDRAALRGFTVLHEQAALRSLLLLLGEDSRSAGETVVDAVAADRRDARAEVVRLLSELSPEEALQEMRRASYWLYMPLIETVRPGSGAEHLVALLQLIERCGDTGALYRVWCAAQMDAATEDERHVRRAAESCLRSLEALADEERSAHVLLRPAEAPDSSRRLLRPAEGASEADPETLLRPVARSMSENREETEP